MSAERSPSWCEKGESKLMVMGVADPGAMNAVYGPYSNPLRSPLSRQEADGTVVQMQRVLEFLIKIIQDFSCQHGSGL